MRARIKSGLTFLTLKMEEGAYEPKKLGGF